MDRLGDHGRITYTAYAGMALVALLAAVYPGARPSVRAPMLAAAALLFGAAWAIVCRLEREASTFRDASVEARGSGGAR